MKLNTNNTILFCLLIFYLACDNYALSILYTLTQEKKRKICRNEEEAEEGKEAAVLEEAGRRSS